MNRQRSKVLIIGDGIAGTTAALVLADLGIEVTLIVSGQELNGGNSQLAQGGVVYAPDANEAELLEKDILAAGYRRNALSAVRFLCQKGPEVVRKILVERARVPFDKDGRSNNFHFTREGGHSSARIIHCADRTGSSIMNSLHTAIKKSGRIQVLTQRTAVDLIATRRCLYQKKAYPSRENRCVGAYIFNEKNQEIETHLADWTVLATGGVGQLYLHTTNAKGSIGSAIAMAQNAGVTLKDLEYVQFHPTALCLPSAANKFLITEAIRGEGATLVNDQRQPFMQKYDQRKELATRDIVARSIMKELSLSKSDCVYLDLTNAPYNAQTRFPTVYQHCKDQGIDITKDLIPVVPAAHYLCGGILTNKKGKTSLKRLYSVGECSCAGVHGSNRLASVSLLEALLWGYSAGCDISDGVMKEKKEAPIPKAILDWDYLRCAKNNDESFIEQSWRSIRSVMWNYVGINRTERQLWRALKKLERLAKNLHELHKDISLSKSTIELFHGCQAALAITRRALTNKHSAGCHYLT